MHDYSRACVTSFGLGIAGTTLAALAGAISTRTGGGNVLYEPSMCSTLFSFSLALSLVAAFLLVLSPKVRAVNRAEFYLYYIAWTFFALWWSDDAPCFLSTLQAPLLVGGAFLTVHGLQQILDWRAQKQEDSKRAE